MADLFGYVGPDPYPDSPGHKGTAETGRDAAADLAPRVGRLQRIALDRITLAGAHGLTADELAEVSGLEIWSARPRTSELSKKGLLVDSGMRRRNASGKLAIVWVTPEHKRDKAA